MTDPLNTRDLNPRDLNPRDLNRRDMIKTTFAAGTAAALASTLPSELFAADNSADKAAVLAQIPKLHAETIKRLQEWIALPSIAAENRNYPQGPEHMAKLARDAGFTNVEIIPTTGKPGVFGLLDSGAPTSVGIYFMYDVKQFDPAEWSSPPLEGHITQKDGLGSIIVGRGAVNQKGPESAFLGALHAFKAAGRKLPVNLVLVCEGEEEIGSPHFPEVVRNAKVLPHLKKCVGIFLPNASQDADGGVTISLGSKGVVELELVSTGEKWGRGPKHDVHSSLEAQVDSPTWHLIQALNTLIGPDGHTPAVAGFFDKAKPLTPAQLKMLQDAARTRSEETAKKSLGVEHWVHDQNWLDSLVSLESKPTINIEGLVAGYTGPGGKTILPHRAVAKIDMRLVPDMKALETLQLLKDHLAKRGFSDIEVNMSGGYDPTQTDPDTKLIRAQQSTYQKLGVDAQLWPRNAGSWPGFVFTDPPLGIAAGHFGLGHGTGAHAPNEYYLIDSTNPKVNGIDGAVRSFVEYLYELA